MSGPEAVVCIDCCYVTVPRATHPDQCGHCGSYAIGRAPVRPSAISKAKASEVRNGTGADHV